MKEVLLVGLVWLALVLLAAAEDWRRRRRSERRRRGVDITEDVGRRIR